MPQLSPKFWALNFFLIWSLLIMTTSIMISTPPAIPPKKMKSNLPATAENTWTW